MAIQTTFDWLGSTAAGQYLADSTPAFAAVQSVHLLALASLGGAVFITDLASLRLIFRNADPGEIARGIFPIFLAALVGMVVSGTLLVAAGPTKYLLNPLFWPKMAALVVAVAIQLALHRVVSGRGARPATVGIDGRIDGGAQLNAAVRPLAALSIIAWLVVAVIGRWVGLI